MDVGRFESSCIEPYPLQVVGEQSYRDEIEEVTGYLGESEGVDADDFIAQLILDNRNTYDPGNAVAIEINGKTVGYLSKGNAKKYRKKLKELDLGDIVGECYASIRGGFERKDGGLADFGVRLDIDLDTLQVAKPHSVPKLKLNAVPEPPKYIVPSKSVKPDNWVRDVTVRFLKWSFTPERRIRAVITVLFILVLLYILIVSR